MPTHPNFKSVLNKIHEINFIQCYPGGRLKYTDLCNLLQLTAGEHAALGGLSFTDMQPLHQAWVLQKMTIKIEDIPFWKDIIQLKTFVIKMESGISTRVIELYKDGQLLVQSLTHWVVMDTKKRRGTTLSLPFEHFLNHNEAVELEHPSFDMDLTDMVEDFKDYQVTLSDLDILSHANNVKYFEWCLNFYNSTDLIAKPIEWLEMKFIRELKEGDTVTIHRSHNQYHSHFDIDREGKKCFELTLRHKKNLPKEV